MKTNLIHQPIRLLATLLALASLSNTSLAVDYHATNYQSLQNDLTLAAADGANDNIYLAAGPNSTTNFYTGNFNYSTAQNYSLTIQGEPGTSNTQIVIDGGGLGRDMNLANTGTGNFTVRSLTFLRNTGNGNYGSLRIAGGTGSTLLVDTCNFITGGGVGIGLEISSGQNTTVTNCFAIGNRSNVGYGVQIQNVAGNISVGNCNISSNNGCGLFITGAGTISTVGNSFDGNVGAVSASSSGSITFVNNTILGNGAGASLSGGPVVVSGNVFTGNAGGSLAGWVGGCNASSSSLLVLSNNVFANNTGGYASYTTYPSAASVSGNSVVMTLNTFNNNASGNTVSCSSSSSAVITGNTFQGNTPSAYNGTVGASLYCGSYATVCGNAFRGNSGGSGAGLYCATSANVSSNTFVGNTASGSGGAAYFSAGQPVISANFVIQNLAANSGGGIFASASIVQLTDNLVVNNSQTGSSYQGGGIYVNPTANLTMINNTVTGNTTTGSGGGLAVSVSGTVEILNVYNNIIWGNSASGNGSDVWLAGTGSKKTFLYNDVDSMYGVWDIAANLLDVAPAFFDPVNGDYHLQSTSTCLNAGTNGAPSLPLTDLDGNSRTNSAGHVDMGCYEFNNSSFHPADVNQDGVITSTEYINYGNAWLNNQTWSTGPNPILDDYVTRAGYLQNQGGTYHNTGAGAPLNWQPGTH